MSFWIYLLLGTFFFASCHSLSPHKKELDQDPHLYSSSLSKEYLLPYLPPWANFSPSGKCVRKEGIFFFELPKLIQSFNLSYRKALELQSSYNDLWIEGKLQNKRTPTSEEEDQIFVKAKERVQALQFNLQIPSFPLIHLIWVDPLLNKKETFQKIWNNEDIHEGFPILVSFCMNTEEVKKWVEEQNIPSPPYAFLTADYLSIYNAKGLHAGKLFIETDTFFQKDQKRVLFIPQEEKVPLEISGNFSIKYF